MFFVWISVFNLFAVSVFWSFMADLFASEQGKRLFGFIAAGGSAGALLGPAVTVALVVALGPVNLLIVAGLLLELAVLCARRLESAAQKLGHDRIEGAAAAPEPALRPEAKGLGGGWLAGLVMLVRSPYLAGIALWVFLLSLAGTFLYFEQANIVAAASDDPAVRTRIFATIDLSIGILTIIVQCFATGRLIARFGVGRAVAFLPLVFGVGFLVLAWTPALLVIIAFQAIQRTANFAISNRRAKSCSRCWNARRSTRPRTSPTSQVPRRRRSERLVVRPAARGTELSTTCWRPCPSLLSGSPCLAPRPRERLSVVRKPASPA